MRNICVLALAALLLSSCGSSDQGNSDQANSDQANVAAAAALQQANEACVNAAMTTIYSDPRDDNSVRTRMGGADLTTCPNDFASAFVEFRSTFGNLIDAAADARAHAQTEDQAVGAEGAKDVWEWLSNTNTGSTPYSDWNVEDQALRQRLADLSTKIRDDLQALEVSAAKYGTTVTTPAPSNTSDAASPPVSADADTTATPAPEDTSNAM